MAALEVRPGTSAPAEPSDANQPSPPERLAFHVMGPRVLAALVLLVAAAPPAALPARPASPAP